MTAPERAAISESELEAFVAIHRGPVFRPGDASYEGARRVWNGLIDKRPAVIARPTGVADVAASVSFGRAHGLPIAIRGGGHNVAGFATCDDGIVIDLSGMKGIDVDPTERTARAQAGVLWGELDRETQVYGLATPGGEVSITGIAGLTLSGGVGYLRRKHGLSSDNLVSVDVVTADGQALRASESENEDLFWALRGGGGNFGVVTSFEYRLHDVGPEVMALTVAYPAAAARDVLQAWRAFTREAPDEVTTAALLWTVPPLPDFPAAIHGEPVIILDGLYAGATGEGEQIVAPLRELGDPLFDLSGKTTYVAAQSAMAPMTPSVSSWSLCALVGQPRSRTRGEAVRSPQRASHLAVDARLPGSCRGSASNTT